MKLLGLSRPLTSSRRSINAAYEVFPPIVKMSDKSKSEESSSLESSSSESFSFSVITTLALNSFVVSSTAEETRFS